MCWYATKISSLLENCEQLTYGKNGIGGQRKKSWRKNRSRNKEINGEKKSLSQALHIPSACSFVYTLHFFIQ